MAQPQSLVTARARAAVGAKSGAVVGDHVEMTPQGRYVEANVSAVARRAAGT
jgi:hypothetical protein